MRAGWHARETNFANARKIFRKYCIIFISGWISFGTTREYIARAIVHHLCIMHRNMATGKRHESLVKLLYLTFSINHGLNLMKVCQFEDLGRSRITERQPLADPYINLKSDPLVRLRVFSLSLFMPFMSISRRALMTLMYQRQR